MIILLCEDLPERDKIKERVRSSLKMAFLSLDTRAFLVPTLCESQTLSNFHSVGFCGPLQSVPRSKDIFFESFSRLALRYFQPNQSAYRFERLSVTGFYIIFVLTTWYHLWLNLFTEGSASFIQQHDTIQKKTFKWWGPILFLWNAQLCQHQLSSWPHQLEPDRAVHDQRSWVPQPNKQVTKSTRFSSILKCF